VLKIAAVVLFLVWVLGLATGRTMGGFVHVLLVLAAGTRYDQAGPREEPLESPTKLTLIVLTQESPFLSLACRASSPAQSEV
jgi:hypothetical protein